MNLEQIVEQCYLALDKFSRGDPEPVKVLFSHRDDVILANPFGGVKRGWKQVSEALDFASSRFRDGEFTSSEMFAKYVATDLASILEIEHWKARVGDRKDVTPFDIRVTTIFRREDDTWKIVLRHADPATTPRPEGPLNSP